MGEKPPLSGGPTPPKRKQHLFPVPTAMEAPHDSPSSGPLSSVLHLVTPMLQYLTSYTTEPFKTQTEQAPCIRSRVPGHHSVPFSMLSLNLQMPWSCCPRPTLLRYYWLYYLYICQLFLCEKECHILNCLPNQTWSFNNVQAHNVGVIFTAPMMFSTPNPYPYFSLI